MKQQFLKGSVEQKAKGDNGEEVFTIIASTNSIDRQGDSIDQAGWDLANFKNNPVLLWAHNYSELPIGRVSSIEVIDGKLVADFTFASMEANPKAQQIKSLYMENIVNASSVGFIPKTREGNIIKTAELLELSLVPVPANQDAVRLAISKGMDVSWLETAIKEVEAIEAKGAVADVVDEMDMREQKWEKWDEISEVMCALYTVYMDDGTPVEDFSKLLTEAVTLLQKVANANGTEEVVENSISKAIGLHSQLTYAEAMKAGKVLSKKNLDLIKNSIGGMEAATSALKELTASVEEGEGDGEKSTTEADKTGGVEAGTVTLNFSDVAKQIQAHLRHMDKGNELILSMVNTFVKSKEGTTA